MRLIDADKCPCIKCWNGNLTNISCNTSDCMFFRRWLETTAYDVDKVVEELEEEQEQWLRGYNQTLEMGIEHLWRNFSGRVYGVASAIDIVKRGGVDE